MVFEQMPMCLRQLLEVQAWIFPVGHLEGEELGGRREISCPYPSQANISQGWSCLEQARNTITTSFQTSFSLVSDSNRTTWGLTVTAAELNAPRNCASLWNTQQLQKHPYHSHRELGAKPVLGAKLSTPRAPSGHALPSAV